METRCLGCMEEYDAGWTVCPNCGFHSESPINNTLYMQPGTMLHERYLVGKALGSGGFGVTYIGWDVQLQFKVAIKEYLPSEFATRAMGEAEVIVHSGNKGVQFANGMEYFIEEAKHLANFRNEEGIIQVFDRFLENNTAYIIMEYLEGETLTSYLKREGKIPFDKALSMLEPAMRSLKVVHDAGIIHKNLTPDNIFLTSDGRVKLIDFGASRHATTSYSRSLSVIIKPGYSPEEQYRSRGDQGPHTDVYALGAVFYKMLTGITPPDALERRAFFETENKDILLPISKECQIDTNKENAILNAMNVRTEDRTKDIDTFLRELHSEAPVKKLAGKIQRVNLLKWPVWAKVSISAAAVCICILLGLLVAGKIGFIDKLNHMTSLEKDETRIVDVTNCSLGVAQGTLSDAGLEGYVSGYLPYEAISPYLVVQQDMLAGERVKKGTRVPLSLSRQTSGTINVENGVMPNLLYMKEEEAVELLAQAGATPEIERRESIFPSGMVIWASKLEGDSFDAEETILLLVSEGKTEDTAEIPRMNIDSTSLYVGDSVQLQTSGMKGKMEWSSTDDAIVSVSEDGKITAKGEGVAIVEAHCKDETVSCHLSVFNYDIQIKMDLLAIFVESSATIAVSGAPGGTEFHWISSDASIAVVENGKITGISEGDCTVHAECTINGHTFETNPIPVQIREEGVILSVYDIRDFYIGDEWVIEAISSEETMPIEWQSSNAAVVTVVDGKLTAVGEGVAEIRAVCGDYHAVCNVTVTTPIVNLSAPNNVVLIGDTLTLSAVTAPEEQSIVSWVSSNESVCTVDGAGVVTVVGEGNADITATFEYKGRSYAGSFTVTGKTPTLVLSAANAAILVGDTVALQAVTDPAGQPIVAWTSSNASICTVDAAGIVTAVGEGSADITATFEYKGRQYTGSYTITGKNPTISISPSANNILIGDTTSINAVTDPAGQPIIAWTSSNSSVCTVDGTGVVTAVGEGSADISATFEYKGRQYTGSCSVTTRKPSVKLSVSNSNILIGDSVTVKATVEPSGQALSWTSSNSSVCSVDGNGTVKGLAAGSATIKAVFHYKGNSYEGTCQISVKSPSISLSKSSITLDLDKSSTLTATTTPGNAKVTWSSSDSSIATVSSSGVVKAVKQGTVQVSAKITHAGKTYTATCSVTVNARKCTNCNGSGFCPHCAAGLCDHCYGFGTQDCSRCNGTGDCYRCYGMGGEYRYTGGDVVWRSCSSCSGLGSCYRCYGAGSSTCGYCRGSGACSYCRGTEDCSFCNGKGTY